MKAYAQQLKQDKKEIKQLEKIFAKADKTGYGRQLIRGTRAELKADYDSLFVIEGGEGHGKSHLAWWIQLLMNRVTEWEKYVILSPDAKKVLNMQRKMPKYTATVLDEGITLLYKKNHMKKATKLIEQYYNINRKENRLSIICIPRMEDLTTYFRNHRARYRIRIVERGVAMVFIKDEWNAKDPFYLDYMDRMRRKRFRNKSFAFMDSEEIIKFHKKYAPNFVDVIHYPKIPDNYEEEYKQEKDKVMINFDEEAGTEDQPEYATEMAVLFYKLLITKFSGRKIAALLNLPRSTLRSRVDRLKAIVEHSTGGDEF